MSGRNQFFDQECFSLSYANKFTSPFDWWATLMTVLLVKQTYADPQREKKGM